MKIAWVRRHILGYMSRDMNLAALVRFNSNVLAAHMSLQPSKGLETFANPNPERDYEIHFVCPEFTCLCPKTGQPDFAEVQIRYVADRLCVELKSFKLYLWSFRNEGHFHEAVTNRIASDLVTALSPRALEVKGIFKVRGGIYTTITVRHGQNTLLSPKI